MTWADLINNALTEILVAGAGQTVTNEDQQWAFTKGRQLLDLWNAQRMAVYADTFNTYTITPSLNPHTIGPSGATWTAAIRPVSIEGVDLVLTGNTPVVYLPRKLRDSEWWNNNTVPNITADIFTDAYYNAEWPNGSLYLWPVPTSANGVRIWTRALLTQLALTDTFSLPPGYEAALTTSLAEMLAPSFSQPISADFRDQARQARAVVFGNNIDVPKLQTRDAGMPGSPRGNADWDYLTGQIIR